MRPSLLYEFRTRRTSIHARWSDLLRTEPVSSPLALPDALVHLIDTTLDAIFTALANPSVDVSRSTDTHAAPSCACGRNPYLAYFAAAEQALQEGLILAQAASAPLDPVERDASLSELQAIFALTSRHEIEVFCGICRLRGLNNSTTTADVQASIRFPDRPHDTPDPGADHSHIRHS